VKPYLLGSSELHGGKRAWLPFWSVFAPIFAWATIAGTAFGLHGILLYLLVPGLVGGSLAAVHHAEVIAHGVGEPLGTVVLAIAVTVIEVALIISLTRAGGGETSALARDAVFAAVMIMLTGILGLCLLVGGLRHREQEFRLDGVTASLAAIAAIAVLTLVLPNYTETVPGPIFSPLQLGLISVSSLFLYGAFILVQSVRHRDYFLPVEPRNNEGSHARPPSRRVASASAVLLFACLSGVVILAKSLAPAFEILIDRLGAPQAVEGVLIAALVLLPEGLAALRAAHADRLQTSLNLALGSALASIGLTIPAIGIFALTTGAQLTLGVDAKSSMLLLLALFVATLSLGTGRTTVLHGVIHLVIFVAYIITTLVP